MPHPGRRLETVSPGYLQKFPNSPQCNVNKNARQPQDTEGCVAGCAVEPAHAPGQGSGLQLQGLWVSPPASPPLSSTPCANSVRLSGGKSPSIPKGDPLHSHQLGEGWEGSDGSQIISVTMTARLGLWALHLPGRCHSASSKGLSLSPRAEVGELLGVGRRGGATSPIPGPVSAFP